ncbi:MAG: protein kinase [Acidobacteriota bacterium]|nr:protein kinase [Acidobacteriota bacterium]
MTPEQWSLVGQTYQAAMERNAAERASFIVNACGGNEVLQREVASLLSAEKEVGDFLQENAAKDFVAPSVGGALSLEGRKLGHYEFVSRLGTGGMGEVYRAHDTKLLRDVAIKILPHAVAQDVDRLRRFEQEARVVSRLNHPNIVTIYETGQAEYGPFLVMELVQGETLRKAVEEALPLREAVRICLQVAQALKVAHASNIVHRDIKPENLMLRADHYVKVLDFGLARLFPPAAAGRSEPASLEARESPPAITKPGMVVGTLRYMSPEQARCEDVSGASDIFSLGLILYELAAGRHPFRATSEYGTLDGILSQPALEPSKINPEIPAALERLILRMLDKRAEARPSASDIEQDLSEIVHTDHFGPAKHVWHDSQKVVGRKREQEQLTALWNAAAAGHGALCCISGEPGIGKTTLVGEFLSELTVSAGTFMWARGQCSERLAGTDAYAPFLEALHSLQRRDAGVEEIARRLAPTWYHQIASGALSEVHARAYSQQRMKRELVDFLQELSTRQTVGLFLEDLHWADLSTIDLLAFLGNRISNLRLLVVITYRPSHLFAQKHPLFKVKQDLRARRIAHEIELEFLSREEVADYMALEFPQHRLPPAVADMIHAKTEGNPLFMTDLLRYFRDREVIAKNGDRWELARSLPEIERHLPESMRAMIERMIGQLDEDDRRLLLAASVQGDDFDSAVIARALGRDDAHVEERLQVVERAHQLVRLVEEREFPTGTLTLAYRFTHVLYQNALYVTIQPARRAQLSNAVAEALVALHGEQSSPVASNLARLFEAGRTFQRAAEYYLQATRNASRVFATTEGRGTSAARTVVVATHPAKTRA